MSRVKGKEVAIPGLSWSELKQRTNERNAEQWEKMEKEKEKKKIKIEEQKKERQERYLRRTQEQHIKPTQAQEQRHMLQNLKMQEEHVPLDLEIKELEEECKLIREQTIFAERKKAELKEKVLKLKQTLELLKAERVVQEKNKKEQLQSIMELKGKVRVFVRVRPLPPDEAAKRVKNLITFSKAIKVGGQGVDLHLKGKVYHFTVDERFSEDASQEDIYKEISPLVQTAHDGSKVSIFAYGQTGSGKTHTMVGSQEEFEQRGLIPRSLEQVFDTSQSHKKSGWTYKVEVSMVELSRHGYFDLSSKKDKIETPNLSKKVDVSCSKDALQHFRMAIARRSKRSMKMNDAASRSHFFFTVYIHGKNEDPMLTSEGVLHFIDLAGSEPMDNTYHSQLDNPHVDSYEESKFIKGSLFDLRQVLRGLVAKPAGARFFYKQRLFKYLQYYLEGSKIVMLANVSSSASSIIKSKITLNFANEVSGRRLKISNMAGAYLSNIHQQVGSF